MACLLNFRSDAVSDIVSAYLWYEEKSIGLGSRFVAEVKAILDYIITYPNFFKFNPKNPIAKRFYAVFRLWWSMSLLSSKVR